MRVDDRIMKDFNTRKSSQGEWRHICITKSASGNVRFYLNGVL